MLSLILQTAASPDVNIELEIAQCAMDIMTLFFPTNGSIFVTISAQQNHTSLEPDHLRFTCSENETINVENCCSLSGKLLEEFQKVCNRFFKPEWNCSAAIKNTTHNEAQNTILETIHSAHSWTLTVETLTSGYRYYYEKFNGFIFILVANEFRDEVDRQRQIMQNPSIRCAKILVIILGYVKIPHYLLVVLEAFSLYESLIFKPDKYGTLQIITFHIHVAATSLGKSPS